MELFFSFALSKEAKAMNPDTLGTYFVFIRSKSLPTVCYKKPEHLQSIIPIKVSFKKETREYTQRHKYFFNIIGEYYTN